MRAQRKRASLRLHQIIRKRERVAGKRRPFPSSKEMGQLGSRPNQAVCLTRGLPLENTPPDCPDTSLQYHSRHWITSFQKIADKMSLPHILCLSNLFTQPLL